MNETVLGGLIGVGGAVVGAVVAAALAAIGSRAQDRRRESSQVLREMPEVRPRLWAPSPYAQVTALLDRIDAGLALAGIAGGSREGLRFTAMKCWQASRDSQEHDPDAGIPTRLLDAYDEVRSAVTTELLAPWWKKPVIRRRTSKTITRARTTIAEREALQRA